MDWTFNNGKYVKYDGGELKCPLKGNIWAGYKNIDMQKEFPVVPLIPSGHYRFDATFTERNRKNVYLTVKLFFEISDNRIEVY